MITNVVGFKAMTDSVQLFDMPLWDKARWCGVGFSSERDEVPCMTLIFTDKNAGGRIFEGLRAVVGAVDHADRLRVTIIEGDIPGEPAGYTVHLGAGLEAVAEANTQGRSRRMLGSNSPHLAGFKKALAQQGRYELMPAYIGSAGESLVATGLKIEKTHVVFKRVSEITEPPDVDSVGFARASTERLH